MAGTDRLTRSDGKSGSSTDSSQWEPRALAKRGGLVHCVSDGEADLAAAQGVVPADRLRVVPNAVPAPPPADPERLAILRRELGIAPEEPVALMAARLAPPIDRSVLGEHLAQLGLLLVGEVGLDQFRMMSGEGVTNLVLHGIARHQEQR